MCCTIFAQSIGCIFLRSAVKPDFGTLQKYNISVPIHRMPLSAVLFTGLLTEEKHVGSGENNTIAPISFAITHEKPAAEGDELT